MKESESEIQTYIVINLIIKQFVLIVPSWHSLSSLVRSSNPEPIRTELASVNSPYQLPSVRATLSPCSS